MHTLAQRFTYLKSIEAHRYIICSHISQSVCCTTIPQEGKQYGRDLGIWLDLRPTHSEQPKPGALYNIRSHISLDNTRITLHVGKRRAYSGTETHVSQKVLKLTAISSGAIFHKVFVVPQEGKQYGRDLGIVLDLTPTHQNN